jgi:hypothetical protein
MQASAPNAMAFSLVKIHASLTSKVPAAPIKISSHSTSAHTSYCSDAVHVNPRSTCSVQSRKPPITSHPISVRRMQPLNIEDPFFRIHNLGEMVPTIKRPTADHPPILFDRTCRASGLHDAAYQNAGSRRSSVFLHPLNAMTTSCS